MTERDNWCPLRGGAPDKDSMGGEEPFRCPSHCLGQNIIVVEERLFAGKFGPEIPKIALTCIEAERPKTMIFETSKLYFRSFKKILKDMPEAG